MARSLTERMIGAALLDVTVYEEVEHDQDATGQAALVVVIVAIAAAIGRADEGMGGMIGAIIGALFGWLIWSAVTYVVGTTLFGGTATWSELLRTLGFAQSPGVLAALGFIPVLGALALVVAGIWQLVTAVVAIRQALDFSTGKAILTAVVGWIAVAVFMIAVFAVLAAVGLAAGAAFGG